jgi:hypothetical protein
MEEMRGMMGVFLHFMIPVHISVIFKHTAALLAEAVTADVVVLLTWIQWNIMEKVTVMVDRVAVVLLEFLEMEEQ